MAIEQRMLGGRYELGAMLGYGGMAEVRRGRDLRLGRDVAIKILRPELARDPTFQARFRREAQAAAALNHPSIVAVYDTGEEVLDEDTVPFIVMEYVEGRTLREVVHEEGRLLPRRALEITAEVCAALEYSHRAGIVHRDIKPGNVMLTPSGDVKVMDFGIARAMTATAATMTQTAAVIGTAQYLSPEQARGEVVDARSDVYSTGCLLYELLTGGPPFVGDSPVAIAYQHVRENPVPPSAVNAEIPPELDAVVLKAMAKNPANRYQSADEMRADLERALTGRTVLATPVLREPATTMLAPAAASTVLMRQPERRRHSRWAYALLALAVLLIIAGLIYAISLLAGGPRTVAAPNVVGMPLASAEHALTQHGLRAGNIGYRYTGHNDKGNVVAQQPHAGSQLDKGASVALTVSSGVRDVQVPYLVGLTQSDAEKTLHQNSLVPGTITQSNQPGYQSGTVLQTTPQAGKTVPAGSKVNLVVASGNLAVPDVRGRTAAGALVILNGAGFKMTQTTINDPTQPPGIVLSQSPTPGTFHPSGTVVSVTVNAQASPSPSASPSPTTSPSPTGSPSPSPSASPSG